MENRMGVPEEYEPTNKLLKILVLSFVGDYPEAAAELHRQIQEELQPDATLQEVQRHLAELASDNFILTAKNPEGTDIYWRQY